MLDLILQKIFFVELFFKLYVVKNMNSSVFDNKTGVENNNISFDMENYKYLTLKTAYIFFGKNYYYFLFLRFCRVFFKFFG